MANVVRNLIALSVVLPLLMGCQSEEAEIKEVVSKYLSSQKGYCLLAEYELENNGRWIRLDVDPSLGSLPRQKRHIAQAEALEAAGLIKIDRLKRGARGFSAPRKEFAWFSLTELGSNFFQEDKKYSYRRSLCMGRQELESIRLITDPAVDLRGLRTTTVKYRFRVVDFPQWTRNADIQAAFSSFDDPGVGTFPGHDEAPNILPHRENERLGLREVMTTGTFDGSLQLIKTNKGWTWTLD
jgi:hypothetical protein